MAITTLRKAITPDRAPEGSGLHRRRPKSFSPADIALLVSSAAAAVSLVWFVFYQLTPFSGAAGFTLTAIGVFLVIYYFANRQVFGRMAATDRVVASLVTLGSVGVVVALAMVIGFLFVRGHSLISWHFFTHDEKGVQQTAPASAGGIGHAIVGTIEQVGIAVLIGAPAGVATAVFLNEVGGRITAAIRVVITAMSAVPSIVAGLFIYVLLILEFHEAFRGIAGSLALAILLLPNITRTTEEVLKVVHGSLREASMALGAPHWRTVWSVVLPTARTGIVTAVLLGIARVVGETAPLIVTIFGATYMEANPLHTQEALPLFVWQSYRLPNAADIQRALSAGLVLVGLVLILFIAARLIASIKPGFTNRMVERLRRTPKEANA